MAIPFARSLTPQTARKASALMGCDKNGRYLRRVPCDHSVFVSNAVHGGLSQRFLNISGTCAPGSIDAIPLAAKG